MLKAQDVVVLLKLLGSEDVPAVRNLAADLDFDVAGTHRALRRLEEAGLYSSKRRRLRRGPAEEFLIHAVKFNFPARWGSEARGIPTSWAAEPLKGDLVDSGVLAPVWPSPRGTVRGLELEPLHPMVLKAAQSDPGFWERLALVDAIRSNDSARITGLAVEHLKEAIAP